MPAHLLVVDDEPNIVELLAASLRYTGFTVSTAGNGTEALKLAREICPDLVVLDVMMPGMDGFDVVRRLRTDHADRHVPVLFLTARDAVEDKVRGLQTGGDDYVTKPFSLDELVARVKALLRRSGHRGAGSGSSGSGRDPAPAAVLSYADLELNEDTYEVLKAGELVELSPTEFKLLRYLLENSERVLSKSQLLSAVWNYDFAGDAGVVESYMSYLRRKVDTGQPKLLHTVRGVGYVLRTPRGA